jgi:hypothetical protein
VKPGICGAPQGVASSREQWIQVCEQNGRNAQSRTRHGGEHAIECHPRGERLLRARLDDRTVSHRIGERHADLENVRARPFEALQQIDRGLWRRMPRRHVRHERAPAGCAELREALGYALR